jgi:hypothetical protein
MGRLNSKDLERQKMIIKRKGTDSDGGEGSGYGLLVMTPRVSTDVSEEYGASLFKVEV